MATVFETRLIGNLGKDTIVRNLEGQVVAINFRVALIKIGKTKNGSFKNKNNLG